MAQNKPQRQRALVVGLGDTGLSCVRFLVSEGWDVSVADTRDIPPQLSRLHSELPDVPITTGSFTNELFNDTELIIVSPGLSLKEKHLSWAIDHGKQVIGDVELFARTVRAPVIAISGSNGKSTVTSLVGEIATKSGLKTAVGGNIGVPVLDLLRQAEPDAYVLELSSFQLETLSSLNAKAATVLNVSADHMDRYNSISDYAETKKRVFNGDGVMVLNRDDPLVMAMAKEQRDIRTFGVAQPETDKDYGLTDISGEQWITAGPEPLVPVKEIQLIGTHNLYNVMAAVALCEVMGMDKKIIREAVKIYRGLPHRCEIVAEDKGISWINDSKATNVGATEAALGGMDRPVHLILGGEGKNADFSQLREIVSSKTKSVVLIGRDADKIEKALSPLPSIAKARDLGEAIQLAGKAAMSGEVVLLSPACASFDMFENFEHRGETFRDLVNQFIDKEKGSSSKS